MVDKYETAAVKPRRPRVSIARMMVGVALTSLVMAGAKTLFIDNHPVDFIKVGLSILDGKHSTIYADSYTESNFRSIKLGMPMREVGQIMGPPLDNGRYQVAVPGQPAIPGEGPLEECWSYTAARIVRGNHWRRHVYFRNGLVQSTESRYYMD